MVQLLRIEHGGTYSCHNAWRIGRWWFTGLLYEWGAQWTFWRKEKRWGTPLHWIGKYFDGQWDDIQGIFQFQRDIFSFILNEIKEGAITPSCDQSSNSCLQLVVHRKYECHKQTPTPPTCCHKTSVWLHWSWDLDAAGPAPCPCRTVMCVNI